MNWSGFAKLLTHKIKRRSTEIMITDTVFEVNLIDLLRNQSIASISQ
jgi:hypothetical protein